MAELLPYQLGVNAGLPIQGDKDDKKPKHRQMIISWNGSNATPFTWPCVQTVGG